MSQKNTLCGGNHCGKCCGGSCNGCGSLELTQEEATFLLTFSVLPFQAVVGKDISDFPVYAYPVCALEENPGPGVRPELISVLAGKGFIEVDYDKIDGTTVQVLALRDAVGTVHAAFNTCQSCSPSPKAYYLQSGDKLVCQNCKFEFTADEVGVVHGGCNPWPIDGIEITETEIRIPEASVEAMVSVFQNWAGPKG